MWRVAPPVANPRVAWANPLAQGMFFGLVPGAGPEMISGRSPVLSGGGKFGMRDNRRQLTCEANLFSPKYATIAGAKAPKGGLGDPGVTLLIVLNYWTGVGGNVDGNIIGGIVGVKSDGTIVFIRSGNTKTSVGALVAGKRYPQTIVCTHQDGFNSNIWVNGVKETFVDDGRTLLAAFTEIGGTVGNSSLGAGIGGIFCINRLWSDGEINRWLANNWQLIEPDDDDLSLYMRGAASAATFPPVQVGQAVKRASYY